MSRKRKQYLINKRKLKDTIKNYTQIGYEAYLQRVLLSAILGFSPRFFRLLTETPILFFDIPEEGKIKLLRLNTIITEKDVKRTIKRFTKEIKKLKEQFLENTMSKRKNLNNQRKHIFFKANTCPITYSMLENIDNSPLFIEASMLFLKILGEETKADILGLIRYSTSGGPEQEGTNIIFYEEEENNYED